MLAYILGITNPGRFWGIQIGTRKIANMGSLRDFKSGEKVYKLGQRCQIGAKRFQIVAEITHGGKRDCKLGQGFQIGAEIINCCRTRFDYQPNLYILKMALSENTKGLWK